jgi:3-dehydrosphinganine reductase
MGSHSHAIITGGSSGIGKAIAIRLAREGADVTIMARRAEMLAAARSEIEAARCDARQRIRDIQVDVADARAIRDAIARAEAECGPCDLAIASAGIALPGYFAEIPDVVFTQTMEVNYFGSLHLARAVLPGMRVRRRGHIVFVSSGAGIIGVYGYSAYSPSKFAVRGLAEVLRAELVADGVAVSIVYPPDTDTPQLAAEKELKPHETRAVTAAARTLTADAVARATLTGVRRRRFAITPGAEMTILYRAHGFILPLLFRYFDCLASKSRRHG